MADWYEGCKFFAFTWKIENISLYTGEMNTHLTSPSFKVGTTKRTEFQVYLNAGDWSTKSIKVRVLGSVENLPCHQDSKLTLISSDGVVIESYNELISLSTGESYLFRNPTLFSNEKVLALFLPQNTLTIRWNIYSIRSGECFFRTVFHKNILRWNIRDFSKSLTFTRLFQHSTIEVTKLECNPSMKTIMVKIIPSKPDRLHSGNCAIAVADGNLIYRYGKVNVGLYNKDVQRSCWKAPLMLNEGACACIKNDTLSLFWEFTVGVGEIWNRKEKANHKVANPQTESDLSEVSPSTLRSDLHRLYEDRKFCDATLKTGTDTFPVHKALLCARSPKFCAIFESDEGRTGVIRIKDIESGVLDRFLRFLYTDSLGNIPWELAVGLYSAAKKYRVQSLKVKCLGILVEKLSVDNACRALVLAEAHREEDLMQAVKDFILDHDEVVCTTDWKELEEVNPRLTTRLLRAMLFEKNK